MSMKTTRKAAAAVLAFLAVYLLIVPHGRGHRRATSSPAPPQALRAAGLSSSQTAILLKIEDPTFFNHSGLSLSDGQGLTTMFVGGRARPLPLPR